MADVLLVEDDVDLAATLEELLAYDGYNVRVAYNGEEGLRALDEHLPDVILLDVEMPVLDGPGMVYAALARDAGRELIPIIVSSGYPGLAEIAAALGTDYWIRKPCSVDRLRNLIRRALVERHPPRPVRQAARSEARQ